MAEVTRRVTRLSHLTLAKAVARLLRGPASAQDLAQATGLHIETVYQLLRALEKEGAINPAGKAKDSAGRLRVRLFKITVPA